MMDIMKKRDNPKPDTFELTPLMAVQIIVGQSVAIRRNYQSLAQSVADGKFPSSFDFASSIQQTSEFIEEMTDLLTAADPDAECASFIHRLVKKRSILTLLQP